VRNDRLKIERKKTLKEWRDAAGYSPLFRSRQLVLDYSRFWHYYRKALINMHVSFFMGLW